MLSQCKRIQHLKTSRETPLFAPPLIITGRGVSHQRVKLSGTSCRRQRQQHQMRTPKQQHGLPPPQAIANIACSAQAHATSTAETISSSESRLTSTIQGSSDSKIAAVLSAISSAQGANADAHSVSRVRADAHASASASANAAAALQADSHTSVLKEVLLLLQSPTLPLTSPVISVTPGIGNLPDPGPVSPADPRVYTVINEALTATNLAIRCAFICGFHLVSAVCENGKVQTCSVDHLPC